MIPVRRAISILIPNGIRLKTAVNPMATASDTPRSWGQLIKRQFASLFVGALRLNRPGSLGTEIIQAINPVADMKIKDVSGVGGRSRAQTLKFRCNHGRLLWRVKSFYTEEPGTVEWMDTIGQDDVLWDVGANVGMYSIYSAAVRHCQVYAFEPEAQNYALLVENIALNKLGNRCFPVGLAVAAQSGIGRMPLTQITKGGAHNNFVSHEPESDTPPVVEQLMFGLSIDELVADPHFEAPTHIKIDVDGLEPEIIRGASKLLQSGQVKSVLVEFNRDIESHQVIPDLFESYSFAITSESKVGQSLKADHSSEVNLVFTRQ